MAIGSSRAIKRRIIVRLLSLFYFFCLFSFCVFYLFCFSSFSFWFFYLCCLLLLIVVFLRLVVLCRLRVWPVVVFLVVLVCLLFSSRRAAFQAFL